MSSVLTYNQQVIVITDASTSFGRSFAVLLAARAAKLVLNYPPSLIRGRRRPEAFVLGRDKASSHGSHIEVLETHEELWDGEKILASALAKYGVVHVLIHNATFRTPENTEDDIHNSTSWDSMQNVVIKGAFKVVKSAWPHFRKNSYGRIVFVDSNPTVGGIGEYAARFALLGFSQTLAREGAKYNIVANIISPKAPYYLTGQDVSPSFDRLVPALTSIAALLAHKSIDASGSIFEVGVDGISKLRWERAKGACLNPDTNFTSAALARQWNNVSDFAEKSSTTSAMDFGKLLPQLQAFQGSEQLDSERFDGKVAIVTGGGSGLGRCYSLAFARLGASVVVNDKADPQAVVNQIRGEGGQAVAVIASVEDGSKIVEAALEACGHVDILVNNAGFVRDRAFVNMDETLWDPVLKVHLDGTYQMTKAIWAQFVRQGHGSIINTTSTSGIYGNFGQANYSTAKLGILGLSEATARAGLKHNIRVNTIAPVASTGGLAQALSGTEDKNKMPVFKPEYIVPVVLLLSSDMLRNDRNRTTGGLFEVGCGWHASTRLRPASKYRFSNNSDLSAGVLLEGWVESNKSEPGSQLTQATKGSGDILETIKRAKLIDISQAEYIFTDRDIILYNLSIGAKRSDLSLLYEESPTFQAIPTFGMIPFFSQAVIDHHAEYLPNFKQIRSLLGEVYLEILDYPIPTSGHLSSTRKVIEVLDKGSAAVGITGYTTVDATSGRKLFYNELSFYMRGAGGFGGPRDRLGSGPSSRVYSIPRCQPDITDDFKTSEEQAALYRLTGDRFAIHIDPGFSSRAGFSNPILHGMCFMGIAGRQVFQHYGAYRSIKVRLAGTVVPGQTLRTEMWRVEKEKDLVVFQTRVLETGKLCIAGGGVHVLDVASLSKVSRL